MSSEVDIQMSLSIAATAERAIQSQLASRAPSPMGSPLSSVAGTRTPPLIAVLYQFNYINKSVGYANPEIHLWLLLYIIT